ncbi:class I SAM-dependent methyltransferase [Cellulomonas wangsupingiae]|uniref:Methyltransferase domain-containing protein n=1 Tax=Cellulomonas wangsupingiae TaxID=2968085 RepID=A0ABY5K826_9CELL|nr:class I SAM-dependent methyltransferase [Cellulomonas wangsupingiae]MCC2333976.1 methyltransferase domain-containing protein [Cellulomonas wangsupingiae]MCM0640968.1 methyltransferase domain-containing protein [Cellulomonas wangsupingiae]UUI65230.1 methyltransferase domain-containing protein [Cellulomonas wangsupingiae]
MPPAIRHVLFPGRHHLVTSFQVTYLTDLLAGRVRDTAGEPVACAPDARVVWALTSATHSGTRRNPVPAHRREAMIEAVTTRAGLPSLVVPVADVLPSPRFAHTVLATSELVLGHALTPADTVVACSTPDVAAMYAADGFRVVTVEDGAPGDPDRPWAVLERMVAGDEAWRALAHPDAVAFYERYRLDEHVRLVHTDPTVQDDGDLTETRDYATYTAAFDDASDRKWAQVAPHVRPGRVVDLGCAAGGLLERAARDPRLAESDLYGVDVSRHLVAEAEHRRAQGVFANPNVFFAQRNLLLGPVFHERSVDTTTTIALTHEIASYGDGRADLELLARRIFDQTRPGGVWINSDVLGPAEPDRVVDLVLDGDGDVPARDLTALERGDAAAYVAALSPAARLTQFTQDFPALSGADVKVEWVERGTARSVARTTLRTAMEYLYTRDYTDSWLSECHERFCDLTGDDWADLLTGVGFELEPGSGPWRNDWLVENRLRVGAALRDPVTGEAIDWPDTHVLTVARRPLVPVAG